MDCAANMMLFMPDAHTLFTVVQGVVSRQPAPETITSHAPETKTSLTFVLHSDEGRTDIKIIAQH